MNMRFHIRTVHTDIRNHKCLKCPKSFKSTSELTVHSAIHNKKFKCEICDIKFAHQIRYKEHLNFHSNPDLFKCKICDSRLTRKSNLIEHLKLHDNSREKNFSCDLCKYCSYEKRSMELHMNGHVNKWKKLRDENYLKCEKCSAVLKDEAMLKSHLLRIHMMRNKNKF